MINKNAPNVLKHTGISVTTVMNDIIHNIRDLESLGMYIYLYSQPKDKNVQIEDLCKHFNKDEELICSKIEYIQKLGL